MHKWMLKLPQIYTSKYTLYKTEFTSAQGLTFLFVLIEGFLTQLKEIISLNMKSSAFCTV